MGTNEVRGRGLRVMVALGILWSAGAESMDAQRVVELPASPSFLEPETVELFEVGSVEGPDHEVFGDVTDVAFGPDGSLHVLDRNGFRVLVFAPDGAFRQQLGREGGGPAEFRLPTGLAVDGEGRVWVGDALGGSLKVFEPDGAFLQVVPLSGRRDLGTLTAADVGVLFLDRTRNATNGTIGLYRATLDGGARVVDRVPVPFVPRMERSGTEFRRIGAPTFTAPTRAVALPAGAWATVHGTRYEVRVADATGPTLTLRAPLDPPPVTDAHREEAKERARERNRRIAENPPPSVAGFQMRPATDEELEVTLERMRFTDEHGTIRAVKADSEGRLWIQRWGGEPWGPAPVDLVSSDGRYLGSLAPRKMPDAVGPDGLVAYVEADEMGVQRVSVLRLSLPR